MGRFREGVAPFSMAGCGAVEIVPELDVRTCGVVGHAVFKFVADVHFTVPAAVNQHGEDFVISGLITP